MNLGRTIGVGLTLWILWGMVACQTATVGETPSAAKGTSESSPLGSMVIGETTWPRWQRETGWEAADWYRIPPEKAEALRTLQQKSQAVFMVFGGSWCGDTHQQLGMIMAILEQAGVPAERVKLYGVDRAKMEPSGTAAGYAIQRVPTLVILSRGAELGRIVEFPKAAWEEDMIQILSRR